MDGTGRFTFLIYTPYLYCTPLQYWLYRGGSAIFCCIYIKLKIIMPNINLIRDHLFEAIGKSYSDEEFDELCFEFGVEVDDVSKEVVEVNI